MNTNKILVAGLVGGVVAFLSGMLIYGSLMSVMAEHMNSSVMRAEEDMIWWAMIVSNLLWGLSIALLLGWSNTASFMQGLTRAGIFGLILSTGYGLSFYALSTWYLDYTGIVLDVVISSAISAIVGGVVGWMLGRGQAAAA